MITVEIQHDDISSTLDAMAARLADMSPLMQDWGEYLVDSSKARFLEGVAPDGTPWAPKTEATKRAYKARKEKIDIRPLWGPTGNLSSQIFAVSDANSVSWGSNLIYSAVMQFGAERGAFGTKTGTNSRGHEYSMPIPWGDIPARPFIGISDEDAQNMLADLRDWIADADS